MNRSIHLLFPPSSFPYTISLSTILLKTGALPSAGFGCRRWLVVRGRGRRLQRLDRHALLQFHQAPRSCPVHIIEAILSHPIVHSQSFFYDPHVLVSLPHSTAKTTPTAPTARWLKGNPVVAWSPGFHVAALDDVSIRHDVDKLLRIPTLSKDYSSLGHQQSRVGIARDEVHVDKHARHQQPVRIWKQRPPTGGPPWPNRCGYRPTQP